MEPESTSSSPASMRRLVDLPQPEGPTSTRNSPSPISRSSESTAGLLVPGYVRVALEYVTVAMLKFPFTGRNVPDDPSKGGAATVDAEWRSCQVLDRWGNSPVQAVCPVSCRRREPRTIWDDRPTWRNWQRNRLVIDRLRVRVP